MTLDQYLQKGAAATDGNITDAAATWDRDTTDPKVSFRGILTDEETRSLGAGGFIPDGARAIFEVAEPKLTGVDSAGSKYPRDGDRLTITPDYDGTARIWQIEKVRRGPTAFQFHLVDPGQRKRV